MFKAMGHDLRSSWWAYCRPWTIAMAGVAAIVLQAVAIMLDEQLEDGKCQETEHAASSGMCSQINSGLGNLPARVAPVVTPSDEVVGISSNALLQTDFAERTHKAGTGSHGGTVASSTRIASAPATAMNHERGIGLAAFGKKSSTFLARGFVSAMELLQSRRGRSGATVSQKGMASFSARIGGMSASTSDVGIEVGLLAAVAVFLGVVSCCLFCGFAEPQHAEGMHAAPSSSSAPRGTSKSCMAKCGTPGAGHPVVPRIPMSQTRVGKSSGPGSQPQLRSALKGGSPGGSSSDAFCPDLVVPSGCECVLVVPLRRATDRSLDLTDMNGNVVLKALLSTEPADARGYHSEMVPEAIQQLVLTSNQGVVLAQCHLTHPNPTSMRSLPLRPDSLAPEFHLFRARGDYFGKVARGVENSKFCLVTVSGTPLYFRGSQEHKAWSITDGAGKLVAATELCLVDFDFSRQYFRMRVAPLMDMGLVLCSVLCIELLSCPDDTALTRSRSMTPPPTTRCLSNAVTRPGRPNSAATIG